MSEAASLLDLVRRTNLLVSLSSLEGVDRVWRLGADAVTLDLREVTTEALSQQARKWIRISIGFAAYGGAEVFIALGKDDVDRHLEAGVWPGIAGIVLYDVDSAEDVGRWLPALESMEVNRGLGKGSLELIPVLESASGVWNVRGIVKANDRIRQVVLDEDALCEDIGIVPQEDIDALVYARGRVVVEAIAAGVQPLDLPHPVSTLSPTLSEGDIREEGVRACNLGFKGALFPQQGWVASLNAAFSPTEEQVAYYTEVRRVFAEGVVRGTAAVPFQGRMIDVPVDEWAKDVLRRADRCRERDRQKREAMERSGC